MIRPVVCVSANAEADLNLLWAGSQQDADDGDLCAIVLEELETDPKSQAMLLSDGAGKFRANGTIVKQWKEHYNKGKDLWSLKFWDSESQTRAWASIARLWASLTRPVRSSCCLDEEGVRAKSSDATLQESDRRFLEGKHRWIGTSRRKADGGRRRSSEELR